MTVTDLFTLLIQGLFILLSVVTTIDWLRHRGEIRRDIALMFSSLGLVFLIQVFERISGSESPVGNAIEFFALISQPYLLLRLVRYFRPVPRRIMRAALAGLFIAWASLFLFTATRSTIVLVVLIAYFAGVNGYSMLSFVRGALTTSGVVRQRLRFAAFGSGFLALTLLLIGLIVIIPTLVDVVTAIGFLFLIACALSFYLAFATPRWLRRTWQMEEIRAFLVGNSRRSAAVRLNPDEAMHDLCIAAIRAVGGSAAAVVQETETGWSLRSASDSNLAGVTADGAETFTKIWQRRKPAYIRLSQSSTAGERQLHVSLGADAMFLSPIATTQRDWGLLVVFRVLGSLFADDDLDLLILLAQQNAILLENSLLIDELRGHSQKLEKVVEERTALLESAPDAMIIVNGQANIEMVNAQAEKLFDYTREELLGQPIEILIPEPFRSRHPAHRDDYIADPHVRAMGVGLELYALRKDGTQFPVEISLSPIETAEGVLISSTVRDITERKRAEDKFRVLLESAPDAMIIVNTQAIIEMVNAQTEKLFGYTRDEVLGQPIEILIPEPYRSRHPAKRDEYIADPHVRAMGVGLELYALRKGGNQFPVEISLSPIETAEGGLIISTVRDITERKRMEELRSLNVELEERVHERTAQLEAINKELEAFSYSVSHDLRAPLRTLDGFSQALLEDYADTLDDTGQNLLRRIRAGSQRMGQLIDDLLQLSRLSRAEMRMAQVDLSAMAHEITAELREQNSSREVKLIVADGLVVQGDIRLLRIALGNLLSNAWKFTGKQPEACVEFGVTEGDQKQVYFVRDNGAGFDMAYADKLFGAFQRLHGMTEFEGTGIGLATVQRVLQRHGGRIWAEAAVNNGATFYFTL